MFPKIDSNTAHSISTNATKDTAAVREKPDELSVTPANFCHRHIEQNFANVGLIR